MNRVEKNLIVSFIFQTVAPLAMPRLDPFLFFFFFFFLLLFYLFILFFFFVVVVVVTTKIVRC